MLGLLALKLLSSNLPLVSKFSRQYLLLSDFARRRGDESAEENSESDASELTLSTVTFPTNKLAATDSASGEITILISSLNLFGGDFRLVITNPSSFSL